MSSPRTPRSPRRDPTETVEQFVAVWKVVRRVTGEAYASLEMGSVQAKVLRHIGKNSRISQAELARATRTAPTLIGRALETLVERGWVRRTRSSEDRRQYLLELTAAGQRTRADVEEVRAAAFGRIDALLDDRDRADLERIGHKLLAVFGDEADC